MEKEFVYKPNKGLTKEGNLLMEIVQLKEKLHRRNMQIKDLKKFNRPKIVHIYKHLLFLLYYKSFHKG